MLKLYRQTNNCPPFPDEPMEYDNRLSTAVGCAYKKNNNHNNYIDIIIFDLLNYIKHSRLDSDIFYPIWKKFENIPYLYLFGAVFLRNCISLIIYPFYNISCISWRFLDSERNLYLKYFGHRRLLTRIVYLHVIFLLDVSLFVQTYFYCFLTVQ